MAQQAGLKLFVWESELSGRLTGVVYVLAHDEAEARALVRRDYEERLFPGTEYERLVCWECEELEGMALRVVTEPGAFAVLGIA